MDAYGPEKAAKEGRTPSAATGTSELTLTIGQVTLRQL